MAQQATFFVQIEPIWARHTIHGEEHPRLQGAKAIGMTLTRPKQPRGDRGTVIVQLTVELPDGVFLPLRPQAVIVVPEGMTALAQPITVEAVDPSPPAEPVED